MENQNEPSVNEVLKRMLEIRDKRAEIKKDFEEKDRKLRQMYERGENWLLDHMQKTGHSSFKADGISVYTSETTRASIPDWNALCDYIRESGNVDLLQKRVNTKNLKQLDEEGKPTPPGVKTEQVVSVNIRRNS